MKKNIQLFFIVSFSVFLFSSCLDQGKGGKSTVKGVVRHHSLAIPNAIVYIKYGATDFPGESPSNYNDQVTADAAGNYEFSKLKDGNYYLYGIGYDDLIQEVVKGGISVRLVYDKTTKTDIPVTE